MSTFQGDYNDYKDISISMRKSANKTTTDYKHVMCSIIFKFEISITLF